MGNDIIIANIKGAKPNPRYQANFPLSIAECDLGWVFGIQLGMSESDN
jgi:hypothetical protein